MKLGVVFSYGVTLGIWSQQGNLHRELAPFLLLKERNKNLKIVFFTYGSKLDFVHLPDSIELVAMGKYWNATPKILRPLYSLLMPFIYYKEFSQCQVLRTNQVWGSWLALIAAHLTRSKLWIRAGYEHYTNHCLRGSTWYKKAVSFFISFLAYQNADLITVTAPEMAQFITDTFLLPENKITVHGNYIDTEIFRPQGLPQKRRVLYVGRLNIHKNIETLIRACADLHIGLTLVGHGEYESALKKIHQELGSDVEFISSIPNHDLPGVYSGHLIFCLPSLFEGNPKVLLEAMSCGMAVVGNNVRGIKELVNNKVDGLLFDGDKNSLKNALNLLINDDSLCKKFGESARKKIVMKSSLMSYLNFEEGNLQKIKKV